MTLDAVRELALTLPGVEEGTSYGTPAFKVRGKLLARLNPEEQALVVRADLALREELMRAEPDVFFLTDHYVATSWLLVRLSTVRPGQLRSLLVEGWRGLASKRLLEAWATKGEQTPPHRQPPVSRRSRP